MSDVLAAILATADETAAVSINMTEVVNSGGPARLLPQGYAFATLVEYTEFGLQPQEFQGKAKEPAMEVQLGFALYGTDPATGETYHNVDKDGVISPTIIRLFPFALKQNDKARSFTLFAALNYEGTKTHFGQLIGKSWVVKVVHEPKSKTDPTIVSRLDQDSFLPPLDPISRTPYPIPATDPKYYRAFFWNKPTKAAWDALHIEPGQDGKSRNFIQERIMGATDFEGSQLQVLLGGGAATLALPGAAASVANPLAIAAAAAPAGTSAVATVATPAPATASVAPAAPVIAAPVVNPAAPAVAQPVAPLQPVQAAVAPVQPIAPITPVQPVTPV
jgi:hypothetical protein